MYKLESKTRFKDMVKINQSIPNIMTLVCPFDRHVEPSERLRVDYDLSLDQSAL